MADFAYLSATDGKAKKWMCNSIWHELQPGERALVSMEVAREAQHFFRPADQAGVYGESTVLVEPFEGSVELAPAVPAQKFVDDATGIEYETLPDLIKAVQERSSRVTAPAEGPAAAHVPTDVKRGPGRPPVKR